MSSTKRFFLVYVSLIAIANSVHAGEGSGRSGEAAGVIDALGNIIGKFAPNQDPNTMQGSGLMNLNGGFGQQGMMQNGMQPVNFQGVPGMNQGGMFPGQMAPGGAMAGTSAQQQIPGTPMRGANGQPIIDPTTGQPVLAPQPGTMAPGTPMRGANGQPIIDPTTGQSILVPQSGGMQNGVPGMNQGGMFPGQIGAGGTMDGAPLNAQTGELVPYSPNAQQRMPGMGGMLAGPIDESVLMDPRLNPTLYEKIMAEAQADPQLMESLERVKLELNAQDAKIVRASLLKPILMRMNLKQTKAEQAAQIQKMQQQQAMKQATEAARRAEEQRIKEIEVEISRLEQENNQIMTDLKRQGVSQEEINAIISRSRQDAVRFAGNAAPLAERPQMPGAIGTPAFGAPPTRNPNAISPLGAPQVDGVRPQQKPGGFPVFGAPQGGAKARMPEMPGAIGASGRQQGLGGLPAFGAPLAMGPNAISGAPNAGGVGGRPQQKPGGFPVFGAQAGAVPQSGGLPAFGAQAEAAQGGAKARMPQMPQMAF